MQATSRLHDLSESPIVSIMLVLGTGPQTRRLHNVNLQSSSSPAGAAPAGGALDCSGGDYACAFSRWVCPAGTDCSATCEGYAACDGMELEGSWTVSCGAGVDVCKRLVPGAELDV